MKPTKNLAKRLLSALTALCLVCAAFPAAAFAEGADADTQESQEIQETVHIAAADDLVQLAQDCRLDSWSQDRVVVLDADIDLSGVDFDGIPIFCGTFEGQDHTVSGLRLTDDGSVQGFFRYVQEGGTVRGLNVSGTVSPDGSRATVGGLAGQNSGTVESCSFTGTVSGTSEIGGIAGENTVTGIVTGCTVSGSVYGSHFVGGMVGQNDGVVSACTNTADVNTTVSQNEVELEDLTLEDLLKTEKAADITDIGGIAGSSAGVVRACVNRGAVGYEHIGYNVGGIAGSQTGYIEGCVNYGTIRARKEGGGIVGQMEPASMLEYNVDTLQELQGELDTLQGLMTKAEQDASATSTDLTNRLNDLQSRVSTARDAVNALVDRTKDGVEELTSQDVTLTDLAELTGEGSAAGELLHTIEGELEQELSLDIGADEEASADDAEDETRDEETHDRPRHGEPSLDVDAAADAAAELTDDLAGAVAGSGSVTLDGEINVELPDLEQNSKDSITAARSSLDSSVTDILNATSTLNASTGSHSQALISDINAITNQISKIGDTLLGVQDDIDNSQLFEDVSDEDTDGDTEGKVMNCLNAGSVSADLNAGGIAGAMARENDVDPEDDLDTVGQDSLNATYKTRIVVRACQNSGAVAAKKQCAGGIVGDMELGGVYQSYNTADLLQDDADYVGGIAGQSKGVIRESAAKCRLSGSRYVGGIAGSAYTVTDCRSMVQASGTENVGAVAGEIIGSDALSNLAADIEDTESDVSRNCFVSEELGGIDGVSYAGAAEPLTFADFAALAESEGLPEKFSTLTATFTADGEVVAAIGIDYGAAFDWADAPEVPQKDGCTARWADFDTSRVVFDQTVAAEYTPYASVIESDARREDGRAVLLAEGAFGDGALTLTACDDAPTLPDGSAAGECWQLAVPDDGAQSHTLRFLPQEADSDVYLCGADGAWRKADTSADGSYLVFEAQSGDTALAAVARKAVPWTPIAVGGAAAAAAAVPALVFARRAAKKKAAKKKAGAASE